MQLHEAREALKSERLTRDLMTKELRAALTRQRRAARTLDARGREIESLKDEVLTLRRAAAAAAADLNEKDDVVKARRPKQIRSFSPLSSFRRIPALACAWRVSEVERMCVQVALQSLKGLQALQSGGSPPRALVRPAMSGGAGSDGVRGSDSVQGYEERLQRAEVRRRARGVAASQADTACESPSLRGGGGGAQSSTEGVFKRGSPNRPVRNPSRSDVPCASARQASHAQRAVQAPRGGSKSGSASSGDEGEAELTEAEIKALEAAGVPDIAAMRGSHKLEADIAQLSSSLTSAIKGRCVRAQSSRCVETKRVARGLTRRCTSAGRRPSTAR